MNNFIVIISNFTMFAFMVLLLIMLPKLTRKDIYFSIRIPVEKLNDSRMLSIYHVYKKRVLLFLIPLSVLLTFIINPSTQELYYGLGIGLMFVLYFTFYLDARKSVQKLKVDENWIVEKKQVTIIDTKDDRNQYLVSSKWFWVGFFIVVSNMIYVVKNYGNMPEQIPIHWNGMGVPNEFITKSPTGIFVLPGIQMFLLLVMYFAYKSIALSKQQIDVSDPEESKIRNQAFKRRWSWVIVILMIVLEVQFTVFNLVTGGTLLLSPVMFSVFIYGVTTFVILLILIVALKTGQGGSRLSFKGDPETNEVNCDDDAFWKLGILYINKNDPSIFVEKRHGIGFTMNFGNPIGIGLFLALLAVIGIMTVLPKIFG